MPGYRTTSTGGASTYYCCDDEDVIGADTLGTYTASGINTFPGQLAEVAFYNYGLSAQQVAAHYAAAGPAPSTTYRVELKAWIPFAQVVDPKQPFPGSYLGVPPFGGVADNCYSPSFFAQFATTVLSTYHGDGHSPYGGSYRVLAVAQFNWNGHSITNFQKPDALGYPIYGQTRRLLDYFGPDGHHQCVAAQPPPAGWPGPSRIVEGSVG